MSRTQPSPYIYLGTHFGLFISYDGGETWPQAEGILNSHQNLFAGFFSPGQVRVSTDGGSSWQTLTL